MTTLYTVKEDSNMGKGFMFVRKGNPSLKDQMVWYEDVHFYGQRVECGYGDRKLITREIMDSLAKSENEIVGINFSGCCISQETICGITFKNCSFIGTYIVDVCFRNCLFKNCTMENARIWHTCFSESKIAKVDFSNAQLRHDSFRQNIMEDLQFSSCIMETVSLDPSNQICNCLGHETICITMGGAREDEVEHHRLTILNTLFPNIA